MQIGIFGDSYADNFIKSKYNPTPSYIKLLYEKYGTINYYAQGGSSLYHSYLQFIKHHEKSDRNIFVRTVDGRLYIPGSIAGNEAGLNISNRANAEHMVVDTRSTKAEIEIANAAIMYFDYLLDIEKDSLFNTFLLKEIKTIRPDTIIIDPTIFGFGNDPDLQYHFRQRDVSNYWDIRHCHLTYKKHQQLFNLVLDCIENNKNTIDNNSLRFMSDVDFSSIFILKTDSYNDASTDYRTHIGQ